MQKFFNVLSLTILIFLVSDAPQVRAQGWFQKATGLKTPDPIRKIAPNGISISPKASQNHSTLSVISPPYIDVNGNVYAGSGNANPSRRLVGRANVYYRQANGTWSTFTTTSGEAFYRSSYRDRYGTPIARRAPQHDRRINTSQAATGPPSAPVFNAPRISIDQQTGMASEKINGVWTQVGRCNIVWKDGALHYQWGNTYVRK